MYGDTFAKGRFNYYARDTYDLVETVKAKYTGAEVISDMSRRPEWFGGVGSQKALFDKAKKGLPDVGAEAMTLAEDAIEIINRDYDLPNFRSRFDYEGGDVDVSRYLAGEPENMIAYDMVNIPGSGTVITLVVGISVSWFVSPADMKRRGKDLVSLVLAIEQMGFQTEILVTAATTGGGWRADYEKKCQVIIPVKKPGMDIDMAQVAFALCDAAFFRGLCLPAFHGFPAQWLDEIGIPGGYGSPDENPDMTFFPEGAIFIPSISGTWKSEGWVVRKLQELGLIDDSAKREN